MYYLCNLWPHICIHPVGVSLCHEAFSRQGVVQRRPYNDGWIIACLVSVKGGRLAVCQINVDADHTTAHHEPRSLDMLRLRRSPFILIVQLNPWKLPTETTVMKEANYSPISAFSNR